MSIKELLKAWEEGVVAATAPALKRREEVSDADLNDHMNVLRIRTHLQTGLVIGSYGKGCVFTFLGGLRDMPTC
jgi:hypothetical protein